VLLSTGGSAEIAGEAPRYEFMVAIDAEDRKDKPLPLIRMASRIEPEWLIDMFPGRMCEHSSVVWNRVAERVDGVSEILYDKLVIQESRGAVPGREAAAELLAQKAIEAGIGMYAECPDSDSSHRLVAADILLRQEPDEEEEDEEDDGNAGPLCGEPQEDHFGGSEKWDAGHPFHLVFVGSFSQNPRNRCFLFFTSVFGQPFHLVPFLAAFSDHFSEPALWVGLVFVFHPYKHGTVYLANPMGPWLQNLHPIYS
jgi:hypothetical protein